MLTGLQRHSRLHAVWQSVAVWGLDKMDVQAFIRDGSASERGRLKLDDELAAKVAEHERRIAEAGAFVMPE